MILEAMGKSVMQEFISEDELESFEGWLRYQGFDIATLTPGELQTWRGEFNNTRERSLATRKVGAMKLKMIAGEYRYAVAVREGQDLWLTVWIRKSRKGEVFLLVPRGDRDWDPHTSYHRDGTLHSKSFGRAFHTQKRQPLSDAFRGTEQLPGYGGFGPKSVGAICNPSDFTGIVEVAPGVLGPRDGTVVVDLVEPDHSPLPFVNAPLVRQEVFRDSVPWTVIRVFS